ncbi:CBS domain-containing protein [Portibacter marinus]|uniref:CBS domain-containing protein n=1 Tax=Portibacter marinus TaxID=2898660 RepID=UPI001F3BF967|nr:CBS domain-containing protein [Portibacter marinus]
MTLTTIDLSTHVSEIMTASYISVHPDASMFEIKEIFESNNFHHLPVVNENKVGVGVISRSDYNKLLHHFTLFNFEDAKIYNEKFFRSLIASDVMTKNPISVSYHTEINEVLKMFMVNKFHCLLVRSEEKCVGVVTPYDFLELLLNHES